jgi:hypothetical protein
MRACAFCLGTDVKITGEHAWPSWIRTFLSPGSKTVSFGRHEKQTKSWPSGRQDLGVAVNDVCQPCNEGWMSALETAAKPILGPMIQGNRVVLGIEQQNVLAMWAHKTAMVFDLITKSSGSAFYRDEDRNASMRNGLSTLSRTFVWLGQLAVPYEASTIDYRMFVKITGPDLRRDAEAFCSTISVGTCVLQVLTLRGLDDVERLRPPFNSAFWSPLTVSLWPIVSSALDWPPSAVMDAQTHSRFIDRWRARQDGV